MERYRSKGNCDNLYHPDGSITYGLLKEDDPISDEWTKIEMPEATRDVCNDWLYRNESEHRYYKWGRWLFLESELDAMEFILKVWVDDGDEYC